MKLQGKEEEEEEEENTGFNHAKLKCAKWGVIEVYAYIDKNKKSHTVKLRVRQFLRMTGWHSSDSSE